MKKIFLCFLAVFMLIPTSSKADTMTLEEYGVTVDFPKNWTVFTRNNIEENEILESLGISASYLKNLMIQQSIYIDALKDELEFFLRIQKNDAVKNLANYKQKDIHKLGEALKEKTKSKNYEILKSNSLVYIKVEYQDQGYDLIEYYTILNGEAYSFTIQKQTSFSENEKKDIEELMKTVKIPVKKGYEKEKTTIPTIAIGAIGGAVIGAIVGIITLLITKKKSFH